MDLKNIPQLLSLGQKLLSVWDQIPATAQDRLDTVVREGVKILPLSEDWDEVRGMLASGGGPLPARLIGAFMNPRFQQYLVEAREIGNPEVQTGVVKCRECGFMQEIEY